AQTSCAHPDGQCRAFRHVLTAPRRSGGLRRSRGTGRAGGVPKYRVEVLSASIAVSRRLWPAARTGSMADSTESSADSACGGESALDAAFRPRHRANSFELRTLRPTAIAS